MQRILCCYSKQPPKSIVVYRLVCFVFVLVVVMVLLFFLNYRERNIEFLWTTTTPSIKTSTATKHLEKYYRVFYNACLESLGDHQWNLRSSTISKVKVIQFQNFVGMSGFANELFHVVHDEKKVNIMDGSSSSNYSSNIQIHKKGTYMIIGNTHANNYHHISDVLLPVFRLFQQTEVTGLLIPEGCVDCWEGRLPIQNTGFDMMNITVLYPMEELISNTTPQMCFDRFIIQRFSEKPYMDRLGRFSTFWPHSVFIDFRDKMNNYARSQLLRSSQEIIEKNGTSYIDNNSTKENSNITLQNRGGINIETIEISNISRKKPVLSWMSRSSDEGCGGRCIKNKQDAVIQLSKYFDVNILDFSTGLTTLQALAHMQETDVLIGLHGAGLAYTAFLPDGAILVELKGEYGNRMFINMASTVNIPYYAISLRGCIGPGENDVYSLPLDSMNNISKEIYDAYLYEKKKIVDEGPSSRLNNGKCEFPHPVEPCGHLSSKDKSKCYLHQKRKFGAWFQCTWYQGC